MQRTGLFLLFILSMAYQLPAQTHPTDTLRTIHIDTVSVTARRLFVPMDVSVGARVSSIGEQVLTGNQTRSLSELLANNTMLYIKSVGQGARATSSFRGTSSSHTQVNWNGININPTMSSAFDFSQIPVFFADNVTLYHGSSHIKNGTGALGGSINILNRPDWQDSSKLKAFTEIGANETYTGAASFRTVRDKSLYQTRVYYQQSENNYRYLNKILYKDPFYERRRHAQYKQAGIMQEAYFRPGQFSTVSTNVWFQYADRNLPRSILTSSAGNEDQRDYALKYLLNYEYRQGRHLFTSKFGYVLDILDYSKTYPTTGFPGTTSFNRSQSFHLLNDYTYSLSRRLEINSGLNYTYDMVNATNYSRDKTNRNVFSVYTGALWKTTDWLSVNGQVVGEVNDGRFGPTFSSGLSARILPKLNAKTSFSYNYKFPSLNELYWNPGGNPDLKPERGFSYDATLAYTPKLAESVYFKVEATYYAMKIRNWIMWLPTDGWHWSPQNIQTVLSHGLELLTETTFVGDNFQVKLGLNYAYSPSINLQRSHLEDDTYRKQLPYIPLNKANVRLGAEYKDWFMSYQVVHVGKRYTTADESYSTNAYTIHDAELGYHFRFGRKYILTPKIRVDNLFDTYYESTHYFPMPLRFIAGSVMLTF